MATKHFCVLLKFDDLATLLSSGFQAAPTVRASSPLPKPVIAVVDNGHSGQLRVDVKKVVNARTYELENAAIRPDGAPGAWQKGGLFTGSATCACKCVANSLGRFT